MNTKDTLEGAMKFPSGWKYVQLGYISNVGTGSADLQDAKPDGYYPFFVRSEKVVNIDYFTHDTEAVLTAGDGNVGDIFHHVKDKFAAHQRVYVIEPGRQLTGRYLYYAMQAMFKESLKGNTAKSTVESLRRPMITSFQIPLPPIAEQKIITAFLDQETAEIDEMIQDFQRLMTLLRERMQSLVDSTFSDVLGGSSKMKYLISGLETGTSVSSAKFEPRQGEPGILATSAVYSEEFDRSAVKSVDEGEIPRLTCAIRENTLLMSRMNTPGLVGKAVTVDRDVPNVYLPDRLWQIDLAVPRYLYWWTRSNVYRDEVQLLAVGASSSMKTLSQQDFMSMKVPIPNVDTQERVAMSLDAQQAYLRENRSNTLQAIALINERRAALISAAVTGQIDVTEKRKSVAEVLEDEVGIRV